MKQIGVVVLSILVSVACAQDEQQAQKFIDGAYQKALDFGKQIITKKWEAASAENGNGNQQAVTDEYNKYTAYYISTYDEFQKYDWRKFQDKVLYRKFFLWSDYGTDALLPDDKKTLDTTEGEISQIIKSSKFKQYGSNDPTLTVDQLNEKVKTDYSDAEKMKFYWTEFHNTIGRQTKQPFIRWIGLENTMAGRNKYDDVVKYWEGNYEVDDYEKYMVPLLEKIQPLYKDLHAYIRFKIWDFYKQDSNIIKPEGKIPASLLGFKWGLDALPLIERFLPFPDKKMEIDQGLQAKGLKGRTMVESVDNFFVSLGFEKLPKELYDNSILEKKGNMDCTPNTFDFLDGKDYRIKNCAEPNAKSYREVVRNVAYTEYSMAYKVQEPILFKRAAGFPFGDAMQNVLTRLLHSPEYLKTIGVLDGGFQIDDNFKINTLFKEALTWLFFLPYGLSWDMFRWQVAQNKFPAEQYNCKFWDLVERNHGVEPPIKRDNNVDFDFGVRSWGMEGNQYMRLFMGKFMEYGILKGLCPQSSNGLIFCDIYNNKEAGDKLKAAMALGNSVPWTDAMQKITGEGKLDAAGVIEFYKPLQEWLQAQNTKNSATPGWPEGLTNCQ